MPDAIDETCSAKFLATLVRGECHYLREIRFDHAIPTVILDYHKDHLSEHAVEVVGDQDGEVMVKDKFTFAPYTGPLMVGDTIGVSDAIRGDRDAGTAQRLRSFGEKEAARLQGIAADTIPVAPFDAEARRAEIEGRSRRAVEEEAHLPRPRPRSHSARAQ